MECALSRAHVCRALPPQAAHGSSTTGQASVLDLPVSTTSQRTKICLGSSALVEESLPAMMAC